VARVRVIHFLSGFDKGAFVESGKFVGTLLLAQNKNITGFILLDRDSNTDTQQPMTLSSILFD
jgi:hypothetical protein